MKKNLLILFLLSTAFAGKGQNMVPNGDFEGYSSCPTGFGQINLAVNWMNPTGGTPDYFNQCATGSSISVPNNFYGYQNPHSGVAYCGIVGYRDPQYPTWREYPEVPLTSALIAGQCYQLEMYISLANNSGFTSDAIGAYFSNTAITGVAGTSYLPYIPQIDINLGLSTDTLNWILITGNFIASGGENYMIIGNFKDDVQTNSLPLGGSLIYSFFYIDDVSLSPCTGIEEQSQNEAITIYPNPVKDELHVQSSKFKVGDEIKIYDVIGKEIYRDEINTSNLKLQTSNYLPGIYFIEINTGKEVYRKKFVKE